MRRAVAALAVAGAALLTVGVCWSYADRDAEPAGFFPPGPALLLAGTLLCLGALGARVALERRADGLVVPADTSLPLPHWNAPVALAGLADLAGGLWASPPLAVAGGVLLAAAAIGAGLSGPAEAGRLDRATVAAAREIVAFGRRHATDHGTGSGANTQVDAVLEHLGRDVVRIVLVAADGAYGDIVVRGRVRAESAAHLAGATVTAEFSRDLGARVRTGSYEWRRMAGSQLGGDPHAS